MSVFADSRVCAALEDRADAVVFLLAGLFICVIACTFFVIDRRSQDLLRVGVPGLKVYEQWPSMSCSRPSCVPHPGRR